MKQGATAPYLCTADNQKKYVIKRQRAGFEGCIKELLLAKLGQSFGLPIPDCQLVYIDQTLLEYNDKYKSEIGEGTAFASEFIIDLQEVNYRKLESLSLSVLRDLYVFDYWVRNADRNLTEHGGNPNLFYKQSSLDVIVLDHNLAFDNEFIEKDHQQLHACSRFWSAQIDFESQQRYQEKMTNALQCWDDLIGKIPCDWKVEISDFDGFTSQLKLILNRYTTNLFWEGLE
tara:strand:+ start:335 stop:1024 length:690 start_codon:yes stop_codon:yes gene_type:complete